MEASSVIVAALLAGAAAAAKDTASQALKDAYSGLKTLIQRRFKGNKSAELALEESVKGPDTWEKPLAKSMSEHGLQEDQEVIDLANRLREIVETEAPATASKYDIHIQGAENLAIGDNARAIRSDKISTDGDD